MLAWHFLFRQLLTFERFAILKYYISTAVSKESDLLTGNYWISVTVINKFRELEMTKGTLLKANGKI